MVTAQFGAILIVTHLALGAAWGSSPDGDGDFHLLRLRFEEPLIATAPTSPRENAALLTALRAYESREIADDFAALHSFLSDYPHSGWRIGLLTNLGLSFYR